MHQDPKPFNPSGEGLSSTLQRTSNAFTCVQNQIAQISLLRCRRQIQRESGHLLITQIILVVLLPSIGTVVGAFCSEMKPFTALYSFFITMVDALYIDRTQKLLLTTSAKAQEQFDCAVFELAWNPFIAGTPLSADTIQSKSDKYLAGTTHETERNWYEPVLSEIPLTAARIAAQLTNLQYDQSLRHIYRYILLGVAMIAGTRLLRPSLAMSPL